MGRSRSAFERSAASEEKTATAQLDGGDAADIDPIVQAPCNRSCSVLTTRLCAQVGEANTITMLQQLLFERSVPLGED